MTERIQKYLAHLGLASRREAEDWIRAGRVGLNGRVAQLGDRVGEGDQLQLDGRPIRQRVARDEPVLLCHRSPGQRLLPGGDAEDSFAAHLPRRAGRRFISIGPLPQVDGGLELLTANGSLAERLQRAVRSLPMEFSLRVRGEINEPQQAGLLSGQLDSGARVQVESLEPAGGEGANRWYTVTGRGIHGNELRQLLERCGITASRVLRTRLGNLQLERSLARGRSRSLTEEELATLLSVQSGTGASGPGDGITAVAAARPANNRKPRGSRVPAATGRRSRDSRVRRSR